MDSLMDTAEYAGPMPEQELAKKKKNPYEETKVIGGAQDGLKKAKNRSFGFDGEAKNTFTSEGLELVNRRYANAQLQREMKEK